MPLITPSSVPSSSQARWHCGGGGNLPSRRLRDLLTPSSRDRLIGASSGEVVEFRSAALAGASLIAGAVLAGTYRAVGALRNRVFVITEQVGLSVVSMCVRGLLHGSNHGAQNVAGFRQVVGERRNV